MKLSEMLKAIEEDRIIVYTEDNKEIDCFTAIQCEARVLKISAVGTGVIRIDTNVR